MQKERLAVGHFYHIYNRGINRQNIFIEARNYTYFLQLYGRYIPSVAQTYAYCLLPNHFHLLVRVREPNEQRSGQTSDVGDRSGLLETSDVSNATEQFRRLFMSYAKAINKAYDRTGSLWQHRYGRLPIDNAAYFLNLITYIHQNPQRHGFVPDFRDWPYTSYGTILSLKPTALQRQEVLTWFGGINGFQAHHREILANDDFEP